MQSASYSFFSAAGCSLTTSTIHSAELVGTGGYLDSQTTDTQYFQFSESQSTNKIPDASGYYSDSEDEYIPSSPNASLIAGPQTNRWDDEVFMAELLKDEAALLSERTHSEACTKEDPDMAPALPPGHKFMTETDLLLFSSKLYADHQPSSVCLLILNKWGNNLELQLSQINKPLLEQVLGNPVSEFEKGISSKFLEECQQSAVSGSRNPEQLPNAIKVEVLALLGRVTCSMPLLAWFTMEGCWEDVRVVMNNTVRNLKLIHWLHQVAQVAAAYPELTEIEYL
ncbi:hypothetical protein B0H10DRAFT_1941630 [Mycena sp. CBHHK59/15]|nr:hypothetical protein B0H10DRAFT_1941630 [Mycena sp. CBHHK59/15]